MIKFAALVLLLSSILLVSSAKAAVSPLAIGIVPPIQFPPSDFNVIGLRVSGLWGQHRSVYGIDIGAIGNITDLDFGGVAVSGIFNMTHGNTNILGLQAAAAVNINTQKTTVVGVQVAAINSNVAESTIIGLQLGPLANLSPHTNIYGLEVGLYNKANEVYGFQIGLVNMVTNLHGLQIGLLNFYEKGFFKVSPFLNIGF